MNIFFNNFVISFKEMYLIYFSRDNSFVKIYAINSINSFSQKAQLEIASSNRALLRFKAARRCLLQFAAIAEQSRFARVLLARVIDSTSKGGDWEVDANGRKIACDSLKSL